MKHISIARLFRSLGQLEDALAKAKSSLQNKDEVPQAILERLCSYEQILEKQKKMSLSLCDYLEKNDWLQVNRHLKMINALSTMLQEDARGIINLTDCKPDHLQNNHLECKQS